MAEVARSLRALADAVPRGAGLGLRHELRHATLENAEHVDFVELIVDDHLDHPRHARRALRPVADRLPIVAHGVRLSVASLEIEVDYVGRVGRLLDLLRVEVYSEHLSFRRAAGLEIEQFVPVPFTEQEAERVAANVALVQRILGRRVALENVAYTLGDSRSGLGEAGFLTQVAERADCALLLDCTNLAVNAANHRYDALEFLDALPQGRVLLAHAAGGTTGGRFHVDSHSRPVQPPTLRLLSEAAARFPLRSVLLERDKDFPPFDELVAELSSLRVALTDPSELPVRLPDLDPPTIQAAAPPPADVLLPRLAATLTTPGAWAALRDRPAEDDVDRWMQSLPVPAVRAFGEVLRFKRAEKIAPHLQGLFRALGPDAARLLDAWYRADPQQSRPIVAEARAFADWLQAERDVPRPVRDLAAHEATVLELRARPWSLRRARRTLRLATDPHAIDVVHRTGEVPDEGPERTVRYTRKRRGVWFEELGGRRYTAKQ